MQVPLMQRGVVSEGNSCLPKYMKDHRRESMGTYVRGKEDTVASLVYSISFAFICYHPAKFSRTTVLKCHGRSFSWRAIKYALK